MKPATLEEALSMLPTHWPLSSRRDKWQKGDQYFAHNLPFDDSDDNWVDVGPYHIESIEVVMPNKLGRRPIPQEVRESAAWWLLYNTLATVSPELDGVTFQVSDDPREKWMPLSLWKHYATKTITGMRKFENNVEADKCIVALGGEQKIIKELSAGPDPLGRWILAGKP